MTRSSGAARSRWAHESTLVVYIDQSDIGRVANYSVQVMPKRTNKPGISTTNRPPRGRGARGRGGRGRGYGGGRRPYRGGYRGRGASFYSPY